jgi:hypothetical protein
VSTSSPTLPPSRPGPFAARDFVDLAIGGSNHPAIVVYVEADRLTVIYGTGTARLITPTIVVEPHTRYGKALKLYKPTYFYWSNVRVVTPRVLNSRFMRCPPGLFADLRILTDVGLVKLAQEQLTQGVSVVDTSTAAEPTNKTKG